MSIWFTETTPERLNRYSENTLMEHLEIEITEVGEDYLRGRMPVDRRTWQPAGILHGGATVSLAESLGSMAGVLCLDGSKKTCVGLEVNANHIRPVRSGYVYGTARPLHLGARTQVWEIRIEDEQERLVSVARLTMAVLDVA